MTLKEIHEKYCLGVDGWYTTDKTTVHDYIDGYYNEEFKDPDKVTDILEIGVQNGGSLILWHQWFKNANITGIDVLKECIDNYKQASFGAEFSRIKIIIDDAYASSIAVHHKDNSYDYIIDDGPHSLWSMQMAIELWMPKVKDGGKLIIEDLQHPEWFGELISHAAKFGYEKYRTFDLRDNKGRYDDLIFELEK
jgi:cephalosporin hydroxylase